MTIRYVALDLKEKKQNGVLAFKSSRSFRKSYDVCGISEVQEEVFLLSDSMLFELGLFFTRTPVLTGRV